VVVPRGDPPDIAAPAPQPGVRGRSVLFLRGALSALRLAASTVAGVVGATLALLPAASAAGPVGRGAAGTPGAKPAPGESTREPLPG
jgi:hypothetical protein